MQYGRLPVGAQVFLASRGTEEADIPWPSGREDFAFRGFAENQVEDEDVGEGMDGIGPTTSTKCARNSC